MENSISTCPVTGLTRKVEVIAINKVLAAERAGVICRVKRYGKDGKELTQKAYAPYQVPVLIDNGGEEKSYDLLIKGKTDEQIAAAVTKYADEKELFNK